MCILFDLLPYLPTFQQMITEQRRFQILHILNKHPHGTALVNDLSDQLQVSGMTIRRDLDWLEQNGFVQRVHGGVVSRVSEIQWASFVERRDEFYREKQAIGALAASLVQDGESILLDAGTTTQQVARALAGRRNLTAITNALPVAEDLARGLKESTILLPGGELRPAELCLVGPAAIQTINQYLPDKLFLSCSGFALEAGITDPDVIEVQVKQAMVQGARQVILVADSRKWNKVTFGRIAPITAIHILISDDGLPAEAVSMLEGAGVRVLTPTRQNH